MPLPTLTRRALLAGAGTAIASAAIAVPYVNAAHNLENVFGDSGASRIDRLVAELSAALDAEYGGEYEVTISEGGGVSWRWAHPTPQQRLETAKSEIAAAMHGAGSNIYTAVFREPSAGVAFVLLHNTDGTLHEQINIA